MKLYLLYISIYITLLFSDKITEKEKKVTIGLIKHIFFVIKILSLPQIYFDLKKIFVSFKWGRAHDFASVKTFNLVEFIFDFYVIFSNNRTMITNF